MKKSLGLRLTARPPHAEPILQVGMRGGDTPPGHLHHPTVDLDPVAVRVEEVEGMASAAAYELVASLGAMHVGTPDDLDPARTHVVEGQEPVFPRVDLEGNVIEAGALAPRGIARRDAGLSGVLRQLEQHDIVVFVVNAHEAHGSPDVGGTPTPRDLETQHLAIEVDGAIDVADLDADVPDAIEMNAHSVSFARRLKHCRLAPAVRHWAA